MAFVSGLDLGQTSDFTALAVLDRQAGVYQCRHLERFQLGTSYTAIVARVVELFRKAPLEGSTLAVDQTGVGRAVVDLLVQQEPGCALVPITITAGHRAAEQEDRSIHVPKKDLVGALQVVLQGGRLKIARSLPEAAMLTKELGTFRVKITKAANETFEAWREGDKDDLVLAVAMAVWVGENKCIDAWDAEPSYDARGEVARAPWLKESDHNDPRREE